MSPFAEKLKALRMQRLLRQFELAILLGYEQSYVSSLELGLKGPPTDEFVEHLIEALNLSQQEQDELRQAVDASQRKISVPNEAPAEVFYLFHKLRQQIDHLHPVQIELILTALNLPLYINQPINIKPNRIRRRYSKPNVMEAKM